MISAEGSTNFASSGLHRKQARKPARWASSAVTKNETFSRFGRRELHDGLQKMPVVRTPKNMTPSKLRSFSVNASQNLSVADLIIASLITNADRFYPKSVMQFFLECPILSSYVKDGRKRTASAEIARILPICYLKQLPYFNVFVAVRKQL
jgi:hypothetical protein